MIKVQHLLALSLTAAFAAQVNAQGVSSISFTGEITQPTCIISMEKTTVILPTVATTAFQQDGEIKVAGAEKFSLSLVQTEANDGVAGAFCPSVSYATDKTGKTKPNFKISSAETTEEGYLKNTADKRADAEHSVAIQILNGTTALDLSKVTEISGEDDAQAVLNFTARYVALKDKVDVQTVTAQLNVSVDYK